MRRTKILFFITFLVLSFQFTVFSQLSMKLSLNKKRYILYENIYAILQIKNFSANPIFFSQSKKSSEGLSFDIIDRDGIKVGQRSEKPGFLSGTLIRQGDTAEFTISLSEFYKINKDGFYSVKAVIKHSDLSSSYMSNTERFTVVSGIKVWETLVGIPTVKSLEGAAKIPERKYEIRSYFDGNYIVYCLVVSDKDYVYGVAEIGVDSGIKKPSCIIDDYSRLHVLALDRTGLYKYYIYDINCNMDLEESYRKTESIPSLHLNDNTGEIEVLGGTKVIEGLDT